MSDALPPTSAPHNVLEFYGLVRGQIEHEDDLMNQRLSWFVASQSFLFTAYAITSTSGLRDRQDALGHQVQLIFSLIPLVALACSVLIYVGLLAGNRSLARLRGLLNEYLAVNPDPVFLPLRGSRPIQVMGMTAPLAIPWVFTLAWVYLFVHGL